MVYVKTEDEKLAVAEVRDAIEVLAIALRADAFGGDYFAAQSLSSQIERLEPHLLPVSALVSTLAQRRADRTVTPRPALRAAQKGG